MQQPSGPHSGASTLFRPQALEEISQTFAWFEEMRSQHPVFYDQMMPMPLWQVFRYKDVATVLTDYRRFSSQALGVFMGSFLKDTLITKDPPDHRKLRNLVNQAFTPRAVARLADRITQMTQELLDQVKAQGKMDVVSDIAFPLPAKVIAEMLGVPPEDWDIFQRWAHGGPGDDQELDRECHGVLDGSPGCDGTPQARALLDAKSDRRGVTLPAAGLVSLDLPAGVGKDQADGAMGRPALQATEKGAR
jgi:cytochrome P450